MIYIFDYNFVFIFIFAHFPFRSLIIPVEFYSITKQTNEIEEKKNCIQATFLCSVWETIAARRNEFNNKKKRSGKFCNDRKRFVKKGMAKKREKLKYAFRKQNYKNSQLQS